MVEYWKLIAGGGVAWLLARMLAPEVRVQVALAPAAPALPPTVPLEDGTLLAQAVAHVRTVHASRIRDLGSA